METITIAIVLCQDVTEIIADKNKLINIPFFECQQHFSGSSGQVTLTCSNMDEKKSIVDIIEFFLNSKKLKKKYFAEYLYWFTFLGFSRPLKFFELSYYEKLDWTNYNKYMSHLENKYEKIFLTFQLITYCDLENDVLNSILENINIKKFVHETYSITVLYELICEAFSSQIYDNLFELLTKQGFSDLPKDGKVNIALYTLHKLISALEIVDIDKIIGDNYKKNDFLGHILMNKYLSQDEIDKAIEIFSYVKTCHNEIFERLFFNSDDKQREVILQYCRTKNKFLSNESTFSRRDGSGDVRTCLPEILVQFDEDDCRLDAVIVMFFSTNTEYRYNHELKKYILKHI